MKNLEIILNMFYVIIYMKLNSMKKYKNSESKLNTKSAILQWWEALSTLEKLDLCEIYEDIIKNGIGTLTSKEIQNIYEKEHS